jgi:hypothetical protein
MRVGVALPPHNTSPKDNSMRRFLCSLALLTAILGSSTFMKADTLYTADFTEAFFSRPTPTPHLMDFAPHQADAEL